MTTEVICVDDEQDVLDIVDHHLKDQPFQVRCYSSPEAALKEIRERPAAIVLSDVNMPEMSGHEFLSRVRDISPESICLNMSSFTDLQMVLEALENNHIYDFIKKPIKKDKLLACLRKANEKHELQNERNSLAKTLEEKNRELQEWNQKLDEQIQVKTRELSLRDHLMQHLAGCRHLEDPYSVIQSMVREFAGQVAMGIYIKKGNAFHLDFKNDQVDHAPEFLGSKFVVPPGQNLLEDEALIQLRKMIGVRDDVSCFQAYALNRYESTLGLVFLYNNDSLPDSACQSFAGLVPLISLLVYDQVASEQLDAITEDITKIQLDL